MDVFILHFEMYFSDKLNQETTELSATEHWIYWSSNRYHKFWLTKYMQQWQMVDQIGYFLWDLAQKWFLHETSIYSAKWKGTDKVKIYHHAFFIKMRFSEMLLQYVLIRSSHGKYLLQQQQICIIVWECMGYFRNL